MNVKDHMLNLSAIFKNSLIQEFDTHGHAVIWKFSLYFKETTKEHTLSYLIQFNDIETYTFTTYLGNVEVEKFNTPTINRFSGFPLLVLNQNLEANPSHLSLNCRITNPTAALNYDFGKLDIISKNFSLKDDKGKAVSTSHVIDFINTYSKYIIQNASLKLFKNEFNALLKYHIKNIFTQKGFTGNTRLYYKISESHAYVIEIIPGRWNSFLEYSFIFRLYFFAGILNPAIKIKKKEDLFNPHSINLYIKNITPIAGNFGFGYPINGRIPLEIIKNIITYDLDKGIFVLLNEFTSKQSIITHFTNLNQKDPNQPYTLNLAILLGIWGDKRKSDKLFSTSKLENEKIQEIKHYYNLNE